MENKKTNKLWIIISLIPFILGLIGGLFFLINKNKVSASSIDFVQENDYTLSLGTIHSYEEGYGTLFSASEFYISFNESADFIISLNVPFLNSSSNVEYYSYNIFKDYSISNSQYNKYQYVGSIPIAFVSSSYNSTNQFYFDYFVERIEVNLSTAYAHSTNFFNNVAYTSITRYVRDGYFINRVACLNSSNVEICTFYFYVSYRGSPQFSNSSTVKPAFKIDRSQYIQTIIQTDKVYINPLLDPIKSIVNGVSNFFKIEILPNFALGDMFLIVLGVTFFGFLLHLIIK